MKQLQTFKQEPYEAPAIQPITPVTPVVNGQQENNPSDVAGGGTEPEEW